jgi:hypothetical protein
MTLVETVVGVGIFSIIILLVTGAMLQSFKIWNRTASQTSTEEALFKVHDLVFKDLTNTSPKAVDAANSLASLSTIPDGDVLWCLSFIDPATGNPVYGVNNPLGIGEYGEPVWQRNIMYYAVVPNNHDALAGQSCTGGDGGEGYEDQCPHKVVVRKVIDGPDDPDTGKEALLADPTPYLDRPNGLDSSAMGGPGVEEVRIIGTNILTFRAVVADPEVSIILRGNSFEQARKNIAVGSVPLSMQPTTIQRSFSVFPKNETGEG